MAKTKKQKARIRQAEALDQKWRGVKSKDPLDQMKSNGERLSRSLK